MRKHTMPVEQQLTLEELLGYSLKEDDPGVDPQANLQASIRFYHYQSKVRAHYVRTSPKSNNKEQR